MKHALILGMTSAAVVAALAGCSTSSKESGTTATESTATTSGAAAPGTSAPETAPTPAAQPGTGRVSLNNAELSAVTGVSCQTDAGVTTITVDSTPKTTVVLSDEASPAVKSVSIGELGGEGPSVAYVVRRHGGGRAGHPRRQHLHRERHRDGRRGERPDQAR